MNKNSTPLIETIAGAIGIFAIMDQCESFNLKHTMIGVVLFLYVFQGFRRYKSLNSSILFCAISALPIVLTVGILLDWIRDTYWRKMLSRDTLLALAWFLFSIIMLVIERKVHKSSEVNYETD